MTKQFFLGNTGNAIGIWWEKDWKFIGYIENFGFGRYFGFTFRNGKRNF